VQEIDPESLMCLDYIMCALDYGDFVGMMLQFKGMQEYEYEDTGEFDEKRR
jgi:hypothetical protein